MRNDIARQFQLREDDQKIRHRRIFLIPFFETLKTTLFGWQQLRPGQKISL